MTSISGTERSAVSTMRRWDIRTVVKGDVMASMTDYNWPARSNRGGGGHPGERYTEEIAANFDPASQVRATDREGLDLAFLQLPLSDESKRRILWDNPARLYKL